jgi:NAD(P)-dependent dehydrogenase (short-subunit alcohol dehydrogenase family)
MSNEPRVAVITGCSSGFGLETALAFARRGDIACATMRNVAKADALRKAVADEGLDVDVVALDVNDDASVERGVAEIEDRHGRVDVLVNNAGVGYGGPIETMPIDAARALMETNFWGALRTIRAVLPGMRARRSGTIVNVTSLAARLPGALYTGLYAASKHALGVVSESLAGEVAPHNVRVVCVEPGFFATEITANADTVADGIASSPYEADATWFDSFMKSSVQSGAHPRVVAEAIAAAVDDPATPLHSAVGDDAELFIATYEGAGSYEGWMAAAIPIVEQTAGPRPAPPAAV